MRIEFWVDYLCPITYISHKNLIEAIEELNLYSYEILYRSFEMINYDKNKYNIMDVWMLHHNKDEQEIVNLLNMYYPEYQKLEYVDVNKAHQLSHLAKRHNVAREVNTLLLKAYFEEYQNISDNNVLLKIAKAVGIDKNLVLETFNNNTFREQILLNRENAFIRDIDRIPHIRINIRNHFNGLLSKGKIIEILEETKNTSTDFTYCSAGVCNQKKAF